MDNRGRRNRDRLYQDEQVSVRYRLDSNAALQPEINPSYPRPEKREQPRVKPDLRVVPGGQESISVLSAFSSNAYSGFCRFGVPAAYGKRRYIRKQPQHTKRWARRFRTA